MVIRTASIKKRYNLMMRTFKKAGIIIALLILVSLLAYKLTQSPPENNAVFTTLDGKEMSMQSLKGKVVLVNFWATDCKSCIAEMPDLINTYHQYQDQGFEIIAVAMPYDPPLNVFNFATQKKLPFPVTHDSGAKITQQFGGVNVTPTAYLFNKDGKRIQRAIGALNFDKLHAVLDKELS